MPKQPTDAQIQRARKALDMHNPIYRAELLPDGTIVLYPVGYRKPVKWKPRRRRAKSQSPRSVGEKAET